MRTTDQPEAAAIASTDAGVNLRELSVWIVSPLMKRNVRSPMRAVVGLTAWRCISILEASGFHTARWAKASRSKSASSSALARVRTLRLKAAVTP